MHELTVSEVGRRRAVQGLPGGSRGGAVQTARRLAVGGAPAGLYRGREVFRRVQGS